MDMTTIAPSEDGDGLHRRERAAIAVQACQTCRSRKSKCDERRPKCGLCRRLGVDCEYREPLPTKKDKTMVHILDTLNRLENKFDNLSFPGAGTPDVSSPSHRTSTSQTTSSQQSFMKGPKDGEYLTLPHKIMLWPGIYLHLLNSGIQAASDLQYVLQEGTPWLIKREIAKHAEGLPADVGLPSFPLNIDGHEHVFRATVAFPTLSVQQIQEYSDAFFNTFNVLWPLLNRDAFMNEIVARLLREGYGFGDTGSVIALLVFALGQVAVEGVFDRPVSIVNGQPSGFRGGSLQHPPGLGMFNEARRRLGFVSIPCTLENVQIMLLQAMYFEANARHLDFWRSTAAASMACQVLIRCGSFDWNSLEGDLVKRAYWTCMLCEDFYHLDLDLPQTGIHNLQDEVPLPHFHDAQELLHVGGIAMNEERSHYSYHFLAMIALRRLIERIHTAIHESSNFNPESSEDYGGPPVHVIREMARQLDSWRALLPRPLQWSDNNKLDFPSPDPTSRRPNEALFAADQGPIPIGHKYNLDIVTAQLRTRFYYARFVMYRPFVYKALHFPELMTADDASCCTLAIRSACLWPLAMAPPKNKKRLVPHLFAWTQNFIGILLILRMTTENECLRQVCNDQVNREDIEKTVKLMLDWVKDARQLDGVADWSWEILEPLFQNQRL